MARLRDPPVSGLRAVPLRFGHADHPPRWQAASCRRTIKLWNGDSRGHWEGNTLVVDVTNNNSKARFGPHRRVRQRARDRFEERYIFDTAGERFIYQAVYTDPTVLTRPFTVTIPNRRITDKTPQDGWNNITFPAIHSGTEPIIEAYERTCVENNGEHGGVAVESK